MKKRDAEHPLSRAEKHGVGVLSDAELLCVAANISDVAAKYVVAEGIAPYMVERRSNSLAPMQRLRVAAALELGRRVSSVPDKDVEPIRTPESIAQALIARYSHHVQERLGGIYLDSKNRIIAERELYIGTINGANVSSRDIIRVGFELAAASVIIFHNHPSGDPSPSAEDLTFTRKLQEAGKLMGLELLDHLIIGANRFVSLKQRGAM